MPRRRKRARLLGVYLDLTMSVRKRLPGEDILAAESQRIGAYRSPGGKRERASAWQPTQYSCLENPHGQRSLVGYSPWGLKDSDMTEVT